MNRIRPILLLVFMLVILTSTAGAQEPRTLSSVDVDLWPEFDKPSMLVIYTLTLPPESSFPVDMEFRIPTSAGVPNAVAGLQPDGVLIDLNYEQIPGEGFSRILFTAPTPIVQIEYYDPNLLKEDSLRQYEYRWPGDFEVEKFSIEVQQPADASDMQISPSMGSGTEYSDGLLYYASDIGRLPLGQTFSISIQYQKETDELTAPVMPVEPSAPIGETSVAELNTFAALPWVLGGLGVLLIAGGGYWYWKSGHSTSKTAAPARRRKKATAVDTPVSSDGNIYCHQCGKRASRGDRFCRACGTQLRTF